MRKFLCVLYGSVILLCPSCGKEKVTEVIYVGASEFQRVDSSPPAVTITEPSEGERVKATPQGAYPYQKYHVWIYFTVSDDTELARITSEGIGGSGDSASHLRGQKTYSSYFVKVISASQLNRINPTLDCHVTVKAYDTAGNMGFAKVHFTVTS